MAVTSIRRSGLTSLIKYDRFTAGNESDFALIESITVGSGGASSVTFSSIPSTYQHLQIRMITRDVSTSVSSDADRLSMRFNNDSGSNYVVHFLLGNGTSTSSGNQLSQTSAYAGYTTRGSSTTNMFCANVVDILDYAQTSKNKTVRSLVGYDFNGSGTSALFSSLWLSTNAITSITLFNASFNLSQHTTISLYGVR